MSQQRSRAGGGRDGMARGWGPGRPALAAALLALLAVGLRGAVPAATLDGSYRHDGLQLAVAAEAVLAGLLVALVARNSRAPRDAIIAARLRRILTYIVVIGLVGIPVAYLFDISAHVHLPARPTRRGASGGQPPLRLHPGSHSATPSIVLIVLLVLAAAVLIYLIARFIAAHRGTWTGWRRRAASAAVEASGDDGDGEDQLREAVESGRSALRLIDDARAAIIACYAAMEQTLARAGTARAAADTPYELLLHAADQGLIRTDAATRLTTLFYEARFSSHPMPPARRDDARHALAEVAASLAEPERAAGAAG